MRYLGKIVEYVRPEQFMVVKQFLLMEAVARVMKMELRQLLREKMKELKVLTTFYFFTNYFLIDIFNLN